MYQRVLAGVLANAMLLLVKKRGMVFTLGIDGRSESNNVQ